MQRGDLIVLGSDGIYDVVSDSKIEEVVNKRDPIVILIVFIFFDHRKFSKDTT